MNVVIILLAAILISISIWNWDIADSMDNVNENLEKILRKMDEK